MLPAFLAMTVRPGKSGKPRVLQSSHAALSAARRFRKGNDGKPNSLRIGKDKLVSALDIEPVPFIGHPAVTPPAQPVPLRIGQLYGRADLQKRFCNFKSSFKHFGWKTHAHTSS